MSCHHLLRDFFVPFKGRVCTLDFLCFSDCIRVPAIDSDIKSVGHDPRPATVPAKTIRSMYYRGDIDYANSALSGECVLTCDDNWNWFCHTCVYSSVSKMLVQ